MKIEHPPEFLAVAPKQILRPADYTLKLAVGSLETQLGTVEAYNRLCAAARGILARIETGETREPATGAAESAETQTERRTA